MAKCPHCKHTVVLEPPKGAKEDSRDTLKRETKGWLQKVVMYSCPHCEAVLGFGFETI